MPTAIMSDHPVAALEEEHHLCIPVVRRQRPTVMEKERLACSPILEVDLRAVFHCNRSHVSSPCVSVPGVDKWAG